MTKPNELTPEQAIERVEGGFHHACDWRPETEPGCGACPACLDNAALRLVIEAAKRPTALSGEERKYFADKLSKVELSLQVAPTDGPLEKDLLKQKAYLTAALSLASPFTAKEAEALKAYVEFGEANELCLEDDPSGALDDAPEAHELIAKLDAMLAQSEQNQ